MGDQPKWPHFKRSSSFCDQIEQFVSVFRKYIDCHTHLHSEESNAGQQVNGGLEILETFWITRREIILREKRERENYYL